MTGILSFLPFSVLWLWQIPSHLDPFLFASHLDYFNILFPGFFCFQPLYFVLSGWYFQTHFPKTQVEPIQLYDLVVSFRLLFIPFSDHVLCFPHLSFHLFFFTQIHTSTHSFSKHNKHKNTTVTCLCHFSFDFFLNTWCPPLFPPSNS